MDPSIRKHIVIVVIALLFFAVGYYAYTKIENAPVVVKENPHPGTTTSPEANGPGGSNPPESSDGTPGRNVSSNIITYTDNGFLPKNISVKKGETVVFKNNSAKAMWPASAKHPEHADYSGTTLAEHCPSGSGTAFDACHSVPAGGSWSFIFDKTGTWAYHDHLNPAFTGSVTVTD